MTKTPDPSADQPAQPPASLTPSRVQALVAYLEHDAQPMLVLDRQYTILAANTAYRRQFGLADRPAVGRTCFSVSHGYDVPCDQAGEHCPMQQALASKSVQRNFVVVNSLRKAIVNSLRKAKPGRGDNIVVRFIVLVG